MQRSLDAIVAGGTLPIFPAALQFLKFPFPTSSPRTLARQRQPPPDESFMSESLGTVWQLTVPTHEHDLMTPKALTTTSRVLYSLSKIRVDNSSPHYVL